MCIKYQFNLYSKKEYFYKIFFPPFTIFVIMTSIMTYLQGFNGIFNTLKVFLGTFLFGWFMIFGFPLIYLYSNHFINGRKTKLKIDNDIIEYSDNNGKVLKFAINDIQKIELWLTTFSYDKRIDFQYFGKYHFTRFYLKTGENFDVSCLIFDKTTNFFSEDLIYRKRKLFPLIREA